MVYKMKNNEILDIKFIAIISSISLYCLQLNEGTKSALPCYFFVQEIWLYIDKIKHCVRK